MVKTASDVTASAEANEKATAVAVLSGSALVINGKTFKTAKWVTRTVLRQEPDVPFYVRIDGPIRISEMDPDNSKFKDSSGQGVVPEIVDVMNLATGEFQVLVVNTVLGSELRRAYPDDGYVGKNFGVLQVRPGKGRHDEIDKRYRTYQIIELEPDGDAPGGANKVNEIDATGPDAIERAKLDHSQKARGNKAA